MISTIHQWENALVGNHAHVCALPVEDFTSQLTPHELQLVANAVAVRQHTFSTGRQCARLALSQAGINLPNDTRGLLRQEDGSVLWPENVIGSISHTNDWAIAVVMKAGERYQSVGIDIEKIDRVEPSVLKLIATEKEREYLDNEHTLRWGRVALFSIKESLYKCLRPIYGKFIRFKDVQLSELERPLQSNSSSKQALNAPALYSPMVSLLLPELKACCQEQRIEIRLAILDSHVVSFVGYL